MDYDRIKILLEKYWECATTIDEERELRHFFSSDTLPPELRPYKAWFLTDCKGKETATSSSFLLFFSLGDVYHCSPVCPAADFFFYD